MARFQPIIITICQVQNNSERMISSTKNRSFQKSLNRNILQHTVGCMPNEFIISIPRPPKIIAFAQIAIFITQHDASERKWGFLIGLKKDKDSETGFSETMKIIFRILVGLKLNSYEKTG